MTMTAATTAPQSAPGTNPVSEGDARLRQARELLEAGRLAPASAAGWQAARSAMAAYAGRYDGADGATGFKEIARRLLNEHRGDGNASEWVFSALALADNAKLDWLGRDGISRRLDDVQRLLILVQDIANPPRGADDILRRAWQCMDNGSLAATCEQGYAAAEYAAKTYSAAMGYDRIRSNHLDQVSHLLMKEPGGQDAGAWAIAVDVMLESAYDSPGGRHPDVVGSGLRAAESLVSFIAALIPPQSAC